jgi:Flp pilus assembly pilin Flp
MLRAAIRRRNDEKGQTMAEYAVVLGLITLAIVTTISVLSGAMNEAFERTLAIIESAY